MSWSSDNSLYFRSYLQQFFDHMQYVRKGKYLLVSQTSQLNIAMQMPEFTYT